ncbi:MAG: HAD-IB family hydrolase [Verrucomicrobia bacterium]|nr:HAD-IB family hydrolase [Verrucomicrobiota bacterium]
MTAPATPAKPVVAVFDFDGTITWADSFIPFLREACGFGKFWSGVVVLSPVTVAHLLGLVSNSRAKEVFIRFFLGGWTHEQLEAVAAKFATGPRLANMVNPLAMDRLAWHLREGHRVVLLSASPEFYLRHWAAGQGIATTLGTRLEFAAGQATGRMSGLNCHGREKVSRLEAELGPLDRFEIHAYGDSRADLHLLGKIQHPHFRSFESAAKGSCKLRAMVKFLCALS